MLNLHLVGENVSYYYIMFFFLILGLLPYVSWLALFISPLVLLLSPILIGYGILLSILFTALLYPSGAAGYWGLLLGEFGLAMLAIFGEIILIPLAFFSPLNLLLAGASYLLSIYT